MARAYARAHELEPQAVAPLAPEPMPTTTMAAVDETVAATEATEAAAPVTTAAKAKQVEQVGQAAAAKHGPAVAPMAQPAIEDEPEPAAHVEAHLIEDEQPAQSKVADADAPREQPAAPGTLAKRTPGRLVRALAIFGLGFKTLFGKDEQR